MKLSLDKLRKGIVDSAEQAAIRAVKADFHEMLLRLARLKVVGQRDAQLEARVTELRTIVCEAKELQKTAGVSTEDEKTLAELAVAYNSMPPEKKKKALLGEEKEGTELLKRIEAAVTKLKTNKAEAIQAPAPEGFAWRVIHGKRKELVLQGDAVSFDSNEAKAAEANNTLQIERLRGNTEKCAELEKQMMELIAAREEYIRKAQERIEQTQAGEKQPAAPVQEATPKTEQTVLLERV